MSTAAVAEIAHVSTGWPTAARTIALPAANLSVFATLWLIQFFVLDRFLFQTRPGATTRPVRENAPSPVLLPPPLDGERCGDKRAGRGHHCSAAGRVVADP